MSLRNSQHHLSQTASVPHASHPNFTKYKGDGGGGTGKSTSYTPTGHRVRNTPNKQRLGELRTLILPTLFSCLAP
ncbi:hypothetical protein FKM82_026651 [Ascaphus truei]